MKTILTFVLVLIYNGLEAQTLIQIKDKQTEEAIPFGKVRFSNGNGILSDLDGYFPISPNDTIQWVSIKAQGYKDTTFSYYLLNKNKIIYLSPVVVNLQDVVVTAGENPAHRIINQVIENRKKNNPTDNFAFKYEAYSKFHFTLDPETLTQLDSNSKDTSILRLKRFFDAQHLFLIETSSERKFIPPARDKETILAYKTSGFSDPTFSTFAREMQSFSFYENQFEILGKTYINPIALGGTKRYLFILQDTTIRGTDTTFTISFRPRKGKNFSGLEGQLFINTNGFAIEKVISQPYESEEELAVKIVQEYEMIDGKYWFPSKLSSEIFIPFDAIEGLKNAKITGKGSSYISNVFVNPPLSKKEFGDFVVETAENAGNKSDAEWKQERFYELDDKEQKTYVVIDSIAKKTNLNKRLQAFQVLSEGKIPMGYVNADLNRVLSYNLYEGYRLGLGLESSEKVSKHVLIGGYFAYGTRDKAWKYGAYTEVKLWKKKDLRFKISYKNDLLQRGGMSWENSTRSLSASNLIQSIYLLNFDQQEALEVSLKASLKPNFLTVISAQHQQLSYLSAYQHALNNTWTTAVDVTSTSLEVQWQFREKVMQLGNARVSLGSKFPKIKAKFTQALTEKTTEGIQFSKLVASISQSIPIRGAGKFTYTIEGSKLWGTAPLTFQYVAPGSGKMGWLSIPSTFETVYPATFFASEQVSVFTRFALNPWKTKVKWFQPQLAFHHAIGLGTLKQASTHLPFVNDMRKGYYEGGIILDRLFVSSFTGFGVGFFTPYGSYALPQFEKNLLVKISLTLGL